MCLAVPSYAIDRVSDGFRVNNGTTPRIDAHGKCRDVNNTSGDMFVATRTRGEWWSFITNPPSGINNTVCPQTYFEYTTSVHRATPTAAPGLSGAGNATAWNNSNWIQIIASTANAIVITGVMVNAVADSAFEIDVGRGGAGSEVVIGTLTGVRNNNAAGPWWIEFPIPIDNVGAGQRVSVRFRKSGTSALAWPFKLTYYDKPVGGNVQVTSQPSLVTPTLTTGTSVTPSGTAWAYSAWTQVIAATATDIVLGAIHVDPGVAGEFEADIGVGAVGFETVVTTIREDFPNGSGGPYVRVLKPALDNIPAGSRVSVRMRKAGTTTPAFLFKLIYYEEPTGVTTHAMPQKWMPTGAPGMTIGVNATAWTNSNWFEITGSATAHMQISAIQFNPGAAAQYEIELGIGAAGEEVPIGHLRGHMGNTNLVDFAPPFRPLLDAVPQGARLAARVRKDGTSATDWTVSVGYYENSNAPNKASALRNSLPSGATAPNIAGINTAWVNTAYTQVTPGMANKVLITGIVVRVGVGSVEYEVDVATGAAGAETVIATMPGKALNQNGNQLFNLPVPVEVAAGTRIAVRFRKEGTSTANWTIGVNLLEIQ